MHRPNSAYVETARVAQELLDLREANRKLLQAAIQSADLKIKAEAALDAAERTARALQESKSEVLSDPEVRERFLGVVSHDLRNPLNAISMSAYLVVKHNELSQADARLIGTITKAVGRMEGVIAHLLDFTRVRMGGGIMLELVACDLRAICAQAIAEVTMQPGVQVRSDLVGDLTGLWDRDRLIQVMANILGNAADHATQGTAVLVRARGAEAEVFTEIINQGEPIASDQFPVLFAPFRVARQDRRSRQGHLGLGLYIAHEIVCSHHGTILARSEGGTTTFAVRLPRSIPPS